MKQIRIIIKILFWIIIPPVMVTVYWNHLTNRQRVTAIIWTLITLSIIIHSNGTVSFRFF
jgi:hypothetical protein